MDFDSFIQSAKNTLNYEYFQLYFCKKILRTSLFEETESQVSKQVKKHNLNINVSLTMRRYLSE